MARNEKKTEQTEATEQPPAKADVNSELAFRAAWKVNQDNMRAVLSETHQVRTGLKPSEIEKANAILRSYGL